MIVGIDASNLRGGGGLTHLVGILRAASLPMHGVAQVAVWGPRATLNLLPPKPWLSLLHDPLLEGPLAARTYWQRRILPKSAATSCDILFAPGGSVSRTIHPSVVMCRNMLPFELREARRFGLSWTLARHVALRFVQAQSFAHADGVIFLTRYAKGCVRSAVPSLGATDTAVIPHGIDEASLSVPRSQFCISDYSDARPFRLLYVSRISPYKHQVRVMRAVSELRSRGTPVVIEFVGGHDTDRALRAFENARRDLDGKEQFVTSRGELSHSDTLSRYRDADAFVYASSCENMPNILLEAMASGLPIACADRGPMPEILGPTGFYFDPLSVRSIVASLDEMVVSPVRRAQVARSAFERSHQYSWTKCADETFRYLADVRRRVLAGAARGGPRLPAVTDY
jgi:glycosyltransferase involved in cell wall biosynthesis